MGPEKFQDFSFDGSFQVGSQIAVFIFLSCIGGNSINALIAGNIILGLSMSSVTPTTITMTEHFMDMSSE